MPQLILDVGKRSTYLIQSFIKIKSLCKDLFCIGDIETLDYSMEVYRQFINREPLDFFISDNWELVLFPTKSKFRENLIITEQLFIKDLKYQFKKIIRKNGKYSLGIYGKKGLFLERAKYAYIFDGDIFFKIEKKFILKIFSLS